MDALVRRAGGLPMLECMSTEAFVKAGGGGFKVHLCACCGEGGAWSTPFLWLYEDPVARKTFSPAGE
jgi:hypothetical protein